VERKTENPVVGNVSLVAIKRNPVREVNVKNRILVPRKIPPVKKKVNPVLSKKEQLQKLRLSQIVLKVPVSRIAEKQNLVAIKRNPVREVNVKNRIPVPRKIPPVKKEKNPAPIKKRTALRKSGKNNFSHSQFFSTLPFEL
jgi:hypothetical protein